MKSQAEDPKAIAGKRRNCWTSRAGRRTWAAAVIVAVGMVFAFLLGDLEQGVAGGAFMRALWLFPLWAVGLYLAYRRNGPPSISVEGPQVALFVVLLLYLISPTAHAPDFFFLNWFSDSAWTPAKSWLERTLLCAGALLVLRSYGRVPVLIVLLVALLSFQISALHGLLQASGGEPLYRVDHPSFFYRLWSWGQTAPRFIYYDPYWNGGSVMPYLVASGVMAPGFLLWPVWRFLETVHSYTPALGFLFLFLVPFVAALSARAVTRDRAAWVLAALLSLGTSHFTFIHLVHYGTFGSLLAASFLLPVSACLYRLIVLRHNDARTWIALTVSAAVVLCWPPAGIMVLPMGVMLLLHARLLTPRLLWGGGIVVLLLAVMFVLPALSLWTHSDIGGFTQSDPPATAIGLWSGGWRELSELVRRTNPVILFAGTLGLWALPNRRMRRFYVPILLTSLLVAAFAKDWKPLLQLDRMWINALYVGILPASLVVGRLLRQHRMAARTLAALLCALSLMTGYTAVKYMSNEGRARYNTMSDEMKTIVHWVRENVPADGRLLFAGAAVHGYGGGKVAALPIFAEREMMAADYYGFSPRLVEYDYPPAEFRREGPEKMFRFMELYNVTHVITYHDAWKDVLRQRSQYYREKVAFGDKTVFEVLRDSDMFVQGAGRLDVQLNRIRVFPADPDASLVIKYNWVDGLSASPASASVSPWETGTSVRLIHIDPGGADQVDITYPRWF